jgi:hypothetical protein
MERRRLQEEKDAL